MLLVDHLPPALQHVPHPVPLSDPLQTRADPPLVPRQPHRLVVADLMETKNIFTTNHQNSRSHLGGEYPGDAGGGAGPHRVQVQLRAPEVGRKKCFMMKNIFN